MGDLTKNFSRVEFSCRCGCGFNDIDSQLVLDLQDIRDYMNKPLIVLSGCRCPKHNAEVGGVPESEHCLGKAADIKIDNPVDRYLFLQVAITRFPRIGINKKYIHVGVSKKHPQEVCWLYT